MRSPADDATSTHAAAHLRIVNALTAEWALVTRESLVPALESIRTLKSANVSLPADVRAEIISSISTSEKTLPSAATKSWRTCTERVVHARLAHERNTSRL